ncbi:hypothetical protein R3P38DRAFT_3512285 [Favolaschia claudopus]|uniref:RING-type domain-containing protein n=1 Tax=Favolaschia claudopus TaxID=2862362 RepID=A0AAV9Z0R7_9AGAR
MPKVKREDDEDSLGTIATNLPKSQHELTRIRRERIDARCRAYYEEWRKTRPPRPQPPKIRIVYKRGRRLPRQALHTEDDLYLDDARPNEISNPSLDYTCSSCLNAKSHPVRMSCGHSACYVCVRILVETDWGCPHCGKIITQKPKPNLEEERAIEMLLPGWDMSRVSYSWHGIEFPWASYAHKAI